MQTGRRLLKEIYPPELLGSLWVRAAKDAIARLLGRPADLNRLGADDGAEQTTKRDCAGRLSNRRRIDTQCGSPWRGDGNSNQCDQTLTIKSKSSFATTETDSIRTKFPTDRFGIRAMHGRARIGRRVAYKSDSQVWRTDNGDLFESRSLSATNRRFGLIRILRTLRTSRLSRDSFLSAIFPDVFVRRFWFVSFYWLAL